MRRILSSLSIRNKLLVINVAVTTFALLFAVTMAVYNEYTSNRNSLIESLLVQAKMVGSNTTAALVFNDKQGAEDILHAFESSTDIRNAVIYSIDGTALASYSKDILNTNGTSSNEPHTHTDLSEIRTHNHDAVFGLTDAVDIIHDIYFENKIIGRLYIHADISHLYDDIAQYLIHTSSMALIALGLASLLLLRLRNSITHPIQQLTHIMDTVAKNNDYSIRSDNHSDDEIGVLSKYFNTMLAHIQDNDIKLAHELSERYKAEKHLDKLAYYDTITGLPNRHFFQERLNNAVNHAVKTNEKMVLLFLDLDNFKIVNDTLGHKTGDILLKQAASRLSSVLRRDDYICRIGGDEFAIIIEDMEASDVVTIVIEKCLDALSRPFIFDDNKFYIGVSIGASICPDDATTSNDLLVNSDIAMYEAKIRGKNSYQFYNHQMNQAHSLRYQLESELRHAITGDQMELYYQPQIDAESGLIVGIEALMRWNHPDKGQVSPDNFIPIAEETGLILPLGEWLINTACQHGIQLKEAGLDDVIISINISGIQIKDNTFIDTIRNALNATNLKPSLLEIELTETTLMNDSDFVIDKLNELKDIGINVAIDDFGTGYSSMSYLKSFSISKLKIDKSFISGLPQRTEDVAITRAIIAMAHGLNIRVVAEGVENNEQAEFLRAHDCDVLQGYYYAKPMPLDLLLEINNDKNHTDNELRLIKGGLNKHTD